eukprot:351151-Chlamydomonas_euryale.AAC.8
MGSFGLSRGHTTPGEDGAAPPLSLYVVTESQTLAFNVATGLRVRTGKLGCCASARPGLRVLTRSPDALHLHAQIWKFGNPAPARPRLRVLTRKPGCPVPALASSSLEAFMLCACTPKPGNLRTTLPKVPLDWSIH